MRPDFRVLAVSVRTNETARVPPQPKKPPKCPGLAALATFAAGQIGAKKARELALALNWTGPDAEKRARRLLNGEADAQFSSVVPLLLIPGVLERRAAELLVRAAPEFEEAVAAAEVARRLVEKLEDDAEPRSRDGRA